MTKRLRSIDELSQLRSAVLSQPTPDVQIRVCSTGCRALGALDVCDAFEEEIANQDLGESVRVVRTGCHGLCAGAVAVVIDPHDIFYQGVTAEDVPEIIEKTIRAGEPVERLCWSSDGETVCHRQDIPFYKNQTRLVLRNCGVVDPRSLEDCLRHGAYSALSQVLSKMSPEQVINEVSASGLRGRGGAGFPTGKKWPFFRDAQGEHKYLIANAHGGDPGAFSDRAIIEGDPHTLIEGMLITAYAIGAEEGIIYLGPEYPIAEEHLTIAIQQARELGLLGEDILGSGLCFDIDVKQAGAFVSGEETALISAVEGKRATPRPRPPFPAQSGLWQMPTNVNNVETLANVPVIINKGAEAYAAIGTVGSKGTKIFSLSGQVRNTGLVEVPMGTTLRDVIFEIGGGLLPGRNLKAVQLGGPSGGCLPAELLDLILDHSSIQETGAIMGSGGIIVMDETNCVVDMARLLAEFSKDECCGKCVPGRLGTKKLVDVFARITEGKGRAEDIQQLERLAEVMNRASLCGLGQAAGNPILTSLRYFPEEYKEHIEQNYCRAGVCKKLQGASH